MIGQYDLSILDCEEVLKRVPQHFGALSGYARMLVDKGQFERALDYMERANLVNPQMQNAAEMILQLRKQIFANKKNMV
jgi:tetratricopeptide (TPR) repeat protein